MRSRIPMLLLALAIGAPSSDLAGQQVGTVTGQVVDAGTGQPIASAQVLVAGTNRGTLTRSDGRFLIDRVPAGQHEVRVVVIGYATASQQVSVLAGQPAALDFELEVTALQLDELVVTGTAGARLRREQAAVISQVDAAELTVVAPITGVADLLQSRTPSVSMRQGNGQSGAGQTIHIRGLSSISLSNEPLIYVDGIRVDARNEIARPDGAESSPATSFDATGGGAAGRLNDINPADIESIEIVKGPAAATLYGADASAGVIHIITKRGRRGEFRQNVQFEYTSNTCLCSARPVVAR